FDTRRIHYDGIRIISPFHHTPRHFRESLQLIASGFVDVKKLITHEMSISEIDTALQLHNEGKAIKIALHP
ncbi:MAG: dehydrogenase, partial [Candidatus Gastranaerophilales bacterium]|nr:dehydrogenase [Candidatus Gastranaerophilales bacterium]